MRDIRVHFDALEEAELAVAWYEDERPGLGVDFYDAIDAATDLLECDPIPSVPMPGKMGKLGIRRIILKRFPYDLVFVERPNYIWVIAYAHHSRRPAYWRDRLSAQIQLATATQTKTKHRWL